MSEPLQDTKVTSSSENNTDQPTGDRISDDQPTGDRISDDQLENDALDALDSHFSSLGTFIVPPAPEVLEQEKEIIKPEKIEPYKTDQDLPDCIIIQKGDERAQETKWYYEVTCDHCKSILLTSAVEKITYTNSWNNISIGYSSTKYRFWCPCCQQTSTVSSFNIRSYHPMVLRNPCIGLQRPYY
jgi:hypothetical protein